jgi:hypothetical protein
MSLYQWATACAHALGFQAKKTGKKSAERGCCHAKAGASRPSSSGVGAKLTRKLSGYGQALGKNDPETAQRGKIKEQKCSENSPAVEKTKWKRASLGQK